MPVSFQPLVYSLHTDGLQTVCHLAVVKFFVVRYTYFHIDLHSRIRSREFLFHILGI
jgi:hypothetical protein